MVFSDHTTRTPPLRQAAFLTRLPAPLPPVPRSPVTRHPILWEQRPIAWRSYPPYRGTTAPAWIAVVREWLTTAVLPPPPPEEHAALVRVLRRLSFDDVLLCGKWRLEWLLLERGYPHYRLSYSRHLFGVAHVPIEYGRPLIGTPVMAAAQAQMAAYLWRIGCSVRRLVHRPGAAQTPLCARVKSLPVLFKIR